MAETIKTNILDPKTTFSSWSVFISLLGIMSGAIFWISGLQNQIKNNTIAITKLPDIVEQKLDANNDKLVIRLDERYEKKN